MNVIGSAAAAPTRWREPSEGEPAGLSSAGVALAIAGSIALWWGSTAVLVHFNFVPEARPLVFAVSLLLALASANWLYRNRWNESVSGAYISFTAGLLVWGFAKASLYTGYIIGPELAAPAADGPSWASFLQAVQLSIYHELLVIALAVTGLLTLRKGSNRFGLYVFLMLMLFQHSAKLNIFFGVRNTGSQLLPETVDALVPFMTTAPMNWFFPFSVTFVTLVAAYLLWKGFSRAEPQWKRVGYLLVGVMAVLALMEHWFLVVPLDGTPFDMSASGL